MPVDPKRKFIALSDSASFFAASGQPARLLQFVLEVAELANPVMRYVGAAKGDRPEKIKAFCELADRGPFRPEILSFFELEEGNPASFFGGADIVFIDGGSTRNLLAILREWGAISALWEAYERGVLFVGASAGASMMFDWCLTDSIRTNIMPWQGIGLFPGTICVHHDARQERREALSRFMATGDVRFPVYALEDGVGLYFENGILTRGVRVADDAQCALFEERGAMPSYVELGAPHHA